MTIPPVLFMHVGSMILYTYAGVPAGALLIVAVVERETHPAAFLADTE